MLVRFACFGRNRLVAGTPAVGTILGVVNPVGFRRQSLRAHHSFHGSHFTQVNPQIRRVQCGTVRTKSQPIRFLSSAAEPSSESPENATATVADIVTMSDRCVVRMQRINESRAEKGESPQALRLMVDSGGCSGFAYQFSLVDGPQEETDLVYERDGVMLVVDELSYDFVKGATVDYTMELIKRAFVVTANPNAEAGCGCGVSFSPKD